MADRTTFDALVTPLRPRLRAHCYRMLGSTHDADDALQDALLSAWRGFDAFAGRSSLTTWLYKIATRACLQVIARRPKRVLPYDRAAEPVWLEPYPVDPHASFAEREQLELAFIAALQHLPATQRAVLIARDVLGCSADETAELLDATVASVTSALQRARGTIAKRSGSQQVALRDLGDAGERELVARFVAAWQDRDVGALVSLLARDVRFTMPPLTAWFDGRDAVVRFFAERIFEYAWRIVPTRANAQLAFACYQGPTFALSALNVITVRDGEIAELVGFLDPAVHAEFGLPTDEFRPAVSSTGS
jgi:RNA polymerase sigma-70 factor (ECF subfamily)